MDISLTIKYISRMFLELLGSPGHKVSGMNYCDWSMSVVRLSVCQQLLKIFSETDHQISMTLHRNDA